jgi:DNA-binding XRE family transcriptional regulator
MKKWAEIKSQKMDPSRVERIRHEANAELHELTLRQLREEAGKTQIELADLAELTQSALSRIERREDNPLEAVRRYVEALGGELELVAVVGNKRVKLLGV